MIHTDEYISIDKNANTMKSPQRICAWCNKVMQEGTTPATHGMCSECLEKQIESMGIQRNVNG